MPSLGKLIRRHRAAIVALAVTVASLIIGALGPTLTERGLRADYAKLLHRVGGPEEAAAVIEHDRPCSELSDGR